MILASMYTGGTVATIVLAMLYARHGEAVAKTVLAVVQILVTGGAIFSAWALQSKKRSDDAADSASASADAALAVIKTIAHLAEYPSRRLFEGKANSISLQGHADMIEEEVKALASMSLTALKPSEAATELVAYRRFTRQWILVCRAISSQKEVVATNDLMLRLNHIHWSEYYLVRALGREIPERLAKLPTDEELEKSLSEEGAVEEAT